MLLAFTGFVVHSSLIGLLDKEVSKFGRSVCFLSCIVWQCCAPGECSDVNPLKISFPALMQFQSQPFSVIFSPGSQNLAANN